MIFGHYAVRSLTREAGSSSRRGVADGGRGSRGTLTLKLNFTSAYLFVICSRFSTIITPLSFIITAAGAPDRPGGGSAESSPYFTRRHHSHNKPLERYQSCMTLPSEGLVDPLDRVRDRARAEGEERGMGTGSSGPASPRSVNSAPCGLEDHHTRASRLGLALPLGMTHSSPTASPQRMEWKVNGLMMQYSVFKKDPDQLRLPHECRESNILHPASNAHVFQQHAADSCSLCSGKDPERWHSLCGKATSQRSSPEGQSHEDQRGTQRHDN